MKILPITKAVVARRYYELTAPGKYTDNEAARKMFDKQQNAKRNPIDKKKARRVLRELQKEQMEMFNNGE